MFKIYMYTNNINNKKYIGQTKRDILVRAGSGGSGYEECTLFYNAIKKYGWNAFSCTILEDNIENIVDANDREEYYISLYNTTDTKFGYNLQSGGNNRTTANVTKLKISQSLATSKKYHINNKKAHAKKIIGISLADKSCVEFDSITDASKELNISRSNIGSCCRKREHNISCGGYIWFFKSDFKDISTHIDEYNELYSNRYSDTRNEKISKSILDKKIDRSYLYKEVCQFDKNLLFIKKYDSIISAAKTIGLKGPSNISAVCNGLRKSAGGYVWKWYEPNSETIGDECNQVAEAKSDAT